MLKLGLKMTKSRLPSALQERNEQEFVEVTRRIQKALSLLERDPTLKVTQDALANLANCSRGTLNNRKWPVDRLKEIKADRKMPLKITVNETTSLAMEETRIERYKKQLYDSREEVLFWKSKYDHTRQQLQQAQDVTRVLQARLKASEHEIIDSGRAPTEKVRQILAYRKT